MTVTPKDGPRPAPQSLLVANMAYGTYRAAVGGSPLALLLLLAFGGSNAYSSIDFWSILGSLVSGVAIVLTTFMVMRGSAFARRVLVALTVCDALLVAASILSADSLSMRLWPIYVAMVAAPVALTVLNDLYLLRAARPAARPASPPAARPTARPGAGGVVVSGPAWLYILPIFVLLAWHWGVPFVSTARAARRGMEAGERQGPPHIASVWVLPAYDGIKTEIRVAPARPAGMDNDSYRIESRPRKDAATVLVFGDGFRRIAARETKNAGLEVTADGRPLKLDERVWDNAQQVAFQVAPEVNGFLRDSGPHRLQIVSGATATSEAATLDVGTQERRNAEWIGVEPRIHHVAAVGYEPGKVRLKLLISGYCRPMADQPGFCTSGFVSPYSQQKKAEVPCTVTVLGRTEECRVTHPNVVEVEAIFGKNGDATGFVQLEIGGRPSNQVALSVPDLIRPSVLLQNLGKEYYQGAGASPAVAALGPIGLLAHLAGPILSIVLFLLLRGWRGQIVIKSVVALTLPTLLAVPLAILSFIPLSKVGSAGASSFSETIMRDNVGESTRLVQSAVVGVLVGLCMTGLQRRREAQGA